MNKKGAVRRFSVAVEVLVKIRTITFLLLLTTILIFLREFTLPLSVSKAGPNTVNKRTLARATKKRDSLFRTEFELELLQTSDHRVKFESETNLPKAHKVAKTGSQISDGTVRD